MRHAATYALLTRRDVLIVASVSCIYGIGTAEAYYGHAAARSARGRSSGATLHPRRWSRSSTSATTSTSTAAPSGCAATRSRSSRLRGRAARSASSSSATRSRRSPRSIRCAARCCAELDKVAIFPAQPLRDAAPRRCQRAIEGIKDELRERLAELKAENKLVEAQRLEQRTMYDLEMLEQMGFCTGIENYSRHLSGREAGRAAA